MGFLDLWEVWMAKKSGKIKYVFKTVINHQESGK